MKLIQTTTKTTYSTQHVDTDLEGSGKRIRPLFSVFVVPSMWWSRPS